MSNAADLSTGIRAFRPFVPAKDFELSRRFYRALGFADFALGDQLSEMRLGDHAFLLQDYYVREFAESFMMHVLVDDLDAWWARIETADLVQFGVAAPKTPNLEPWGLRVFYVNDPAGVLWHIAAMPC